ncbi:MAG TPA: carbohydrate-binding domain-containing protein, partial [Desulfuromonadaceae bacterium]|nr:carbohydrate-binding domain-containing protein [Desulfuromonadaceae bacterium]
PVTGDGSLYINGSLKVYRSYPTSDRQWYFKNGTYNNGLPSGHKSTAWFKNIKSWVKSSVTGTTVSFEAENLAVSNSGVGTSVQADANSSNGEWISLNAVNTGSWMEFTTGTVQAGTYSVKMMWKGNNNRGVTDFFVDGNQVGGTLDQYSSTQTYPTTTFGTVTFGSSGTHKIRMHVTGKNASSTGYVLSADKFTFTAQ